MKLLSQMETEEIFDEMAKLKIKMKKLEEQYKNYEAEALEKYNKKFIHKNGTFTPTARDCYSMDNCAIAKTMGMASFKEHAKISKTGIEKGIGKKGFEKLLKDGSVVHTNTVEYYVFRQKKKK